MINLSTPVDITSGRVPPRMSPEDYKIWERYKPQLNDLEILYYFDVGLGDGRPVPPNTEANIAEMWLRNTQLRADMVIDNLDEYTIVEFRHHASANAIGRLLIYQMLFKEDIPALKPVKLRLVTDVDNDELRRCCNLYWIELIVV
jgi:hypothetical protein